MRGPAIYITEGIVHNSSETIAAAKALIIRKRAGLAITADQARSAWTDLETDDEDLEAQISTVLRHRDVFGPDYSSVIRGCVIGEGILWRGALEKFVADTRAANGALYGEIHTPLGFGMFGRQGC
ncbi:hypothetical protein [Paraburkholderia sp. SIMBA_053]|uniref:hypothetical protein n=1 Tax=Paraburkholderia sp. SIMBA_053 TaxID=3085794 RepID=UPI00397D4260